MASHIFRFLKWIIISEKKKRRKKKLKWFKYYNHMSVYVTQFYSSYIFSLEETSPKGYLKLNSLRNIIASLPTIL